MRTSDVTFRENTIIAFSYGLGGALVALGALLQEWSWLAGGALLYIGTFAHSLDALHYYNERRAEQ